MNTDLTKLPAYPINRTERIFRQAVPTIPPFVPEGLASMRGALEIVGAATFKRGWSGEELRARALPPLVGGLADMQTLCRAGSELPGGARPGSSTILMAPMNRGAYEAEYAAWKRYEAVQGWLRQRLFAGDFPAFNLSYREVLPSEWGGENFATIAFRYGHSAQAGFGAVFFFRSNLSSWLEGKPVPKPDECATIALAADRTPKQQPGNIQDQVETWIRGEIEAGRRKPRHADIKARFADVPKHIREDARAAVAVDHPDMKTPGRRPMAKQ